MTWALVLALAAVLGVLAVHGHWRDRARTLAIAAMLALGLVGYAIAGQPDYPAQPAAPPAPDGAATAEYEASRLALLDNYGDAAAWLSLSDAMMRQGHSAEAVRGLQVALRAMPDNADLWIGLGQALTVHGEGYVNPAARLAFDRASQLDPKNPAPRFFLGLAFLQAGKPGAALAEWQALRQASPDGAPWLPELDRKIGAAETMIALGAG